MAAKSLVRIRGFTLVELSVVLVIIGLLSGAVVVGQDLIKAAAIRSTISEIQQFNAAVTTFSTKYGALPGDMPPSQTAKFNFFTFTGSNAGTAGYGDGNGSVAGFMTSPRGNEQFAFWRHLMEAFAIDTKLDDGMPYTGIVFANGNMWNPTPAPNWCTTGGGGGTITNTSTYNMQYPDTQGCFIIIQAAF